MTEPEYEIVLRSSTSLVRYAPPATLEFTSHSDGLDHAALYVGTFLGSTSVLVSGLILAGLAPRILLLVTVTWALLSAGACVFALRSRRRYGTFVMRFDRGVFETRRGSRVSHRSLREGVRFELRKTGVAADDGPAPGRAELVLLVGPRELSLATGDVFRMRRVVALLEDFGAAVAATET